MTFICVLCQISNEDFGTDLQSSLVLASLVYLNRLAKQLDHVQDFYRVISIFFAFELDKTIALMLIGHFVPRYVHIHDWASLKE